MGKYTWTFNLRENAMTKDVMDDYTAVVKSRGVMTTEDIAKEIVRERTEYRADTVENILSIFEDTLMELLCQGYTIQTKAAHYRGSITGVFAGTGIVDPAVNQKQINISPTKELRDALEKVELEYSSVREDQGGAKIETITDLVTGLTNGHVGRGHMIRLEGTRIRCLNADGSGMGRLYLVGSSDIETDVEFLGVNKPSEIIFNFPDDLTEGSYDLCIETYYTTGTKLLKSPRTLVAPLPIVVVE